ncbi:MAG: hypothetical protein ACE5H8_06615 [Alphaproteobacteria bacterium]
MALNSVHQFDPSRAVPGLPAARRLLGRIDRRGFIVSPLYDTVFFIGAPPLAFVLGVLLYYAPLDRLGAALGVGRSPLGFLLGAFIFAHLFIVVFRSHLNPKIFGLHPLRFTLVPLALFLAMGLSPWVLVSCSVLVTFWDVYHSGAQTFGLGRIYDARAGNDPATGRRLDWLLNILLYAGPIAAGATLMDHVGDFDEFAEVGSVFFTSIPAYTESHARYLTWGVVGLGAPFILYYLYAYWRLVRRGYRISPQKVVLFVGTGICSIWAWGFNPFGMAFFIMNFFHAFQYFAIVWWAEKGNMTRIFGLDSFSWGKPAALVLFLVIGFGFGIFAEASDAESPWLLSGFLVVSLMHFWYDGFVWSVTRKQV